MRRFRDFIAAAAFLCAGALLASTAHAAETLTLADAIDRALRIAPALDAATAQSDLSSARVAEARAPLYPSIQAGAEYNQAPGYDQIITNRGLTLAQLMLDYTVYDGGRRSDQARAARYAAQAAALGVDTARAQIVFDVSVAYFDLMRQRDRAKELDASLERLRSFVRIVEALERSGRAIATDVLRIRTTRDAAQLALAAVQQDAEHASIVLASLIGQAGATDLQVEQSSALPTLPTGEITDSPAYRAAARQVQAARLTVDAAEAERAPSLELALTSGWEGIDPPRTFSRRLGASYDGAVSVPIFTGGLLRSHVDQAMAAERAALAQQRQVELNLKRDLADATARYQSARRQFVLLAQSQSTSDDAFALDWTRFLGGGAVTLLEVTDAYQQAENLRMARFDQEFAARQAAARAKLLLGLSG